MSRSRRLADCPARNPPSGSGGLDLINLGQVLPRQGPTAFTWSTSTRLLQETDPLRSCTRLQYATPTLKSPLISRAEQGWLWVPAFQRTSKRLLGHFQPDRARIETVGWPVLDFLRVPRPGVSRGSAVSVRFPGYKHAGVRTDGRAGRSRCCASVR